MNDHTIRVINRLREFDWFSHVGEPINDDVTIVKTWDEAISYRSSTEYQNLLIRERNRITEPLAKANKSEFNKWNERVALIKTAISSLINKVVENVELRLADKQRLANMVTWDILHICLVIEYDNYVTSKYYSELGELYFLGHFPCGWEGDDYPSGRHIVY